MLASILIVFGISFNGILAWERLPDIPSGRRSEYYVLHENGQYKYGYDTGDGIAAKQSGDAANQVDGHYFYKSPDGQKIDLKYSAGVQGFIPQGSSNVDNIADSTGSSGLPSGNTATLAYGSLNPDGSYAFGFNVDNQSRQESADGNNNVQGSYSYNNQAGTHDLSYVAGSETGFKPTGGSLSIPNGLPNSPNNNVQGISTPTSTQANSPAGNTAGTLAYGSLNPDGSYSFGFETADQSRQESADSNSNVQGSYSYKNQAGTHDLSYVAGSETGFKPTGGSLSIPNGLPTSPNSNVQGISTPTSAQANLPAGNTAGTLAYGSLNPDGSYSFGFKSADQSRQESADSNNNVQGSYSYKNQAGTHDLSYVAGSETGFKPTGGSLSISNSLPNSPNNNVQGISTPSSAQANSPAGNTAGTLAYGSLNPDGSYSFGFETADQSRQESADSNNNVQGSYSYKNQAGTHDLSYVAGSETGFKPTGGSLSIPNGLPNSPNNNVQGISTPTSAQDNSPTGNTAGTLAYGSLNPDGSYSFGFKSADQSRQESADSNNNVQGSYSYKNQAGTHDLSYVAGSETGFKPTGGSLSIPNGLPNSPNNNVQGISTPISAQANTPAGNTAGTLAYGSLNPDGSYSFGFESADQSRQESADSNNNVQGSYSYKNQAGTHDLSYVAGSETGFKPTGGSLSIPNGLPNSPNNNVQGISTPTSAQANSPAGNTAGTLAYGSLNPDGSYAFGFTTDDQSRQESADAKNNVQGSYSYKNSAGTHYLSYVAGSETGFKPTGGSLSVPNGLQSNTNNNVNKISSLTNVKFGKISQHPPEILNHDTRNPDGSYSFGFNTNDQSRQESADAKNNVEGNYSYKNSAGVHDLSYVAGQDTGFKPTGGSLAIPNGLPTTSYGNTQAASSQDFENKAIRTYLPPIDGKEVSLNDAKINYKIGNLAVHTYLPPSNEKHKFGYIFDTKS